VEPIAKFNNMAAKISQIPRFRFMSMWKNQFRHTSVNMASAGEPGVTVTHFPIDLMVKAIELSATAPR